MASFAKRIAGRPWRLKAWRARTAAMVFALVVFLPYLARAETVEGVARIVDGDTIEISDQKIRIWGIDAPEPAQRCTESGPLYPCGLDASRALAKQIGRKPVTCTRRDTDRYGRIVALCTVDGVDISRWMVRQGQAIAFRKYSLVYIGDEHRAKEAKAGIWAGEFQDPSAFRRQSKLGVLRERGLARRACTCSADIDRTGRRCGARSAYMRPGGLMPACAVPEAIKRSADIPIIPWQGVVMPDYDDPESMLRSSIWFALQQCRYQPPKTHDATARDAYYGKVADKVMEYIKLSRKPRMAWRHRRP